MQAKLRKNVENFGQRLKFLRIQAGYKNVDAFAASVGVSRATAYNWEGRDKPTNGMPVENVAKALNCTIQEILNLSKSEIPSVPDESRSLLNRREYEVISLNEDSTPFSPKEPIAGDCTKYLEEYLSHAREVTGGIGHCLMQLKFYLPIEKIKQLKEEENP